MNGAPPPRAPQAPVREADYVVVGGGTAGSVLAARLSERSDRSVLLLEWGPSDVDEPRAHALRRWAEMLEGEYDLDYRSVPQERGNSAIRQARARILGGCSTANTMISWRPRRADLQEWVEAGADGWDAESVWPCFDRLATPIHPVAHADQNPMLADAVASIAAALDIPLRTTWNDEDVTEGAGFFELGYTPETNQRSSASISYLHPVLGGRENLQVLTGRRAVRVVVEDGRAAGVVVRLDDGTEELVRARREVVLSCGAIDTPKLLMLSGIGPRQVLDAAGVEVVVDSPGVGENLQDHAEALVVWEATRPVPQTSASGWDAGALVRLGPAAGGDGQQRPDLVVHVPVATVAEHAVAAGAELPVDHLSLAPNVAKPRSRGRVWITSGDVEAAPSIDYRYFTDPEGHDEKVLVAAVRTARAVAEHQPLASWVSREVFPGPDVQSDEAISAVARATHQTVYHVCGTARMGRDDDRGAVLDPQLRVRGVSGLRVADASAFPTIPSVNPVVTVLVLAERAAELIDADEQRRPDRRRVPPTR